MLFPYFEPLDSFTVIPGAEGQFEESSCHAKAQLQIFLCNRNHLQANQLDEKKHRKFNWTRFVLFRKVSFKKKETALAVLIIIICQSCMKIVFHVLRF